MKARPILFSGSMVRALLAGTKTQTRRIVKPQPEYAPQHCHYSRTAWARSSDAGACTCDPVAAPYGVPGDLLWVRESFTTRNEGSMAVPRLVPMFAADWDGFDKPDRDWDWSPSIHMPRRASRLTLDITDVRVERLQDISEADAIAEGVTMTVTEELPGHTMEVFRYPGGPDEGFTSAKAAYRHLWNAINGKKHPWASNPWVWAVSGVRHQQNVDALMRAKEAA